MFKHKWDDKTKTCSCGASKEAPSSIATEENIPTSDNYLPLAINKLLHYATLKNANDKFYLSLYFGDCPHTPVNTVKYEVEIIHKN